MTFTTRPTLRGTFGMVSSTHWLASASAMSVLEKGGNAFDAAVAAGFVFHVVEPHLNGPGGEVPIIFARADDPRPVVLAGQGPAPAGATIEHFRSLGLDLVPGAGLLAATVPAAVDAWLTLLRDHGSMPVREVLAYAIGYALHGHPVVRRAVETIERVRPLFEQHWPSSAELWLPGGHVPQAGQLLPNRAYAATLERLVVAAEAAGSTREAQVDEARRAWREGFVAEAIDAFVQQPRRDSSGRDHAGVLRAEDVAAFELAYEEPVTAEFRDVTVAKTQPWGQGPVLLQMLQLLEPYDDGLLDPGTPDGIHVIAEAMKLALADREAWYGDSGGVPMAELLEPGYAAQRRALIGDRASTRLRPGSPGGRTARVGDLVHAASTPSGVWFEAEPSASTGEPTVSRLGEQRGDTCHVDVVDRWGNIVSATPSGGWLQSSPAIPELGFCLGTRLQMCWLEPGLPSSLVPGRRPRTTLSPTLVMRHSHPALACGSPGGDQQDQWQLLFLLRHLVMGMDLQEAIDAPMWHTTSFPSSFYPREMVPGGLVLESRLAAAATVLRDRGHDVSLSDPWSLGRLCAVARDPDSGVLSAGANPRGMQGYASGR